MPTSNLGLNTVPTNSALSDTVKVQASDAAANEPPTYILDGGCA